MSLHPPKGFLLAITPKPAPAARVLRQAWGMTISAAHVRRPRILRLEVSRPRGGTKEIRL